MNIIDDATTFVGAVGYCGLPIALWVVFGGNWPRTVRTVTACIYAPLAVLTFTARQGLMVDLLAYYIYYVVVACLLHIVTHTDHAARPTAGGIFVALAFFCLLLPAIIAYPHTRVEALAPGWTVMLSGYSYYMEQRDASARPPLSTCVQFVVFDPTVVYTMRARATCSATIGGGVRRTALGLATLAVAFMLLDPIRSALPGMLAFQNADVARIAARRAALMLTNLTTQYAHMAGLASFNIGLWQCLGYKLPEQFDHPLRAVSPLDFWRRWNIYVGTWIRRYIFSTLALPRGPHRKRVNLTLRKCLAAAIAFGVIGLLHDGFEWCVTLQLSYRWFVLFLLVGAGSLGWHAFETLLRDMRRPVEAVLTWAPAYGLCRRACLIGLATGIAGLWAYQQA